jgi:hypothetical protein
MVSQDRHEIYLIIAEYDDAYLDYIKNENQPDPPSDPYISTDSDDSDDPDSQNQVSLMTMHQFGPWNVSLKHHMKELGELMLALMLQDGKLDFQVDDPSDGSDLKGNSSKGKGGPQRKK